MRRIIVVGCPGSGKTRLALNLGRKLGLPVVHLDVLYWLPGWKASDKTSFRARVVDAIAGEGWVVDGSFSGLAFDLTLARSDTLIVIDRPRLCSASGGSPAVQPLIVTRCGPTCPRGARNNSTGI
jgi:adenylate kinase family enzyme